MEKTLIIENNGIKKEFNLSRKRISAFRVVNKLSQSAVEAQEGSEEFALYFKWGLRKSCVPCSSLKIKSAETEAGIGKNCFRFIFRPFNVRDSKIRAELVYTVKDGCNYLAKHIELYFEEKGKKAVVLDRIEFEKLSFDPKLRFWSVPKQKNSHVPGFALTLGQPVYLDSFYMGSEFPAAVNKIEKQVATVTVYSGRTLDELIGDSFFKSRRSVIGASESDIFQQVQKAFYAYIRDISKPDCFRRQYNSWYDNMLNITKENVYSSFLEIEKGLTMSGEPALDSYVADDGWNDYSKGFWSFNEKFPDELYPFTELAENLGSEFGLWIGPRGGYTTDTPKFARSIERAGNGYYNKNAKDICVASERYVRLMKEMMLDFQKKYSLNYYKLDGFAQYPCKSKKHDHLVGGKNDMYFYSDVWEKWIDIFENLGEKGKSDFWINLTCYAPPSPWFLQWVNSIWMQISDDMGFIGNKNAVSDKDRMLTYRDEKYYDFYNVRQFQLPQRCVYNHDPIFAAEAKVSVTDDDFRSYLYSIAARGGSFWELYYSHSMMNAAKWRINYAVMRFIEENRRILSNSVIFGARPSSGSVYGYSCFEGQQGIVCLRNASDKAADYTFRLDELIGVDKEFSDREMCTVLPYTVGRSGRTFSYGDKVKLQLDGYETRILHFGKQKKPLRITYIKAVEENVLEVQFNQSVDVTKVTCSENTIKNAVLLEDYMTARITFENSFEQSCSYCLSSVGDILGNCTDITAIFDHYKDYIVTSGSITGDGDFTVIADIKNNEKAVLYSQGDELSVEVEENGFIKFTCGSSEITSATQVRDAVQVAAVRERNNVIKLYVNKKLEAGTRSASFTLSGKEAVRGDGAWVTVYNKALSYDCI